MEEKNEEWHSCCTRRTTDSNLMKYVTQLSVSFIVLGFSLVQIIRDVPNKDVYFAFISCIVGIYVPAPTHRKEN